MELHAVIKRKPKSSLLHAVIEKETESFLRANKQYLLNNKEIYYSIINRKLTKKYMKQNVVVTPVNAYVPPQSKLSPEELDKQLEQEAIVRKQKEQFKGTEIKRAKGKGENRKE